MRWARAAAVPSTPTRRPLLAPSAHTRGSAVWSTGVAATQPERECCRPVARAGGKRAPAFLTGCAETQVGWAAVGWRGWEGASGVAPGRVGGARLVEAELDPAGQAAGRQQAPALVADRPGDLDPLGLEGGHRGGDVVGQKIELGPAARLGRGDGDLGRG